MSVVPVQVVVAPSPIVAVDVTGAIPVTITTGMQGPPGLPGEAVIAGHTVVVSNLSPGDHIEFTGVNWYNVHKTSISDGGNF